MKPCLVQTLFLSVHESRSLEKASLWRRSKKMPIGVIPAASLPTAPLRPALTTLARGPDPSTFTTWGP
jgi:hypothetical protein